MFHFSFYSRKHFGINSKVHIFCFTIEKNPRFFSQSYSSTPNSSILICNYTLLASSLNILGDYVTRSWFSHMHTADCGQTAPSQSLLLEPFLFIKITRKCFVAKQGFGKDVSSDLILTYQVQGICLFHLWPDLPLFQVQVNTGTNI